jgi:hypothetical protein
MRIFIIAFARAAGGERRGKRGRGYFDACFFVSAGFCV